MYTKLLFASKMLAISEADSGSKNKKWHQVTLGKYLGDGINVICAAAAAKSLQPCPTLCDPIDGSPPGSPVPGILQARTLEWVAISFSNEVCTFLFFKVLIYNSQKLETVPKSIKSITGEWMNKMWCMCVCIHMYTHTHTHIYVMNVFQL